jgi:predicted homoserine dehydrogenase-like protein
LRGEATGAPDAFRADAAAAAKRDLKAGEILDGEGGYMVHGRLMPARDSLAQGALPIGLAHQVKLVRPVKAGAVVTWRDVAADEADEAVKFRREMERVFGPAAPSARAAE